MPSSLDSTGDGIPAVFHLGRYYRGGKAGEASGYFGMSPDWPLIGRRIMYVNTGELQMKIQVQSVDTAWGPPIDTVEAAQSRTWYGPAACDVTIQFRIGVDFTGNGSFGPLNSIAGPRKIPRQGRRMHSTPTPKRRWALTGRRLPDNQSDHQGPAAQPGRILVYLR
jgi:hypothetical protein